jgi:hypothetical protein
MNDEQGMKDPRFTGDPTQQDPTFEQSSDFAPEGLHTDHDHAVEGLNALDNQGEEQPQAPQEEAEPEQAVMSDSDLLALIKRKIETSHQWYGSGKLSSKRIDADKYYRGEPLGNELEGRSQVVSRDVAEAIDGAMPSVMRVFAGGDSVVAFEPHGQEDEAAAEQATDYINHIFMNENEGFMILYTWFKDSFLKKNGIVKAWHDVRWKKTKDNYEGLTQEQMMALQSDQSVQITNVQPVQSIDPMGQPVTTFSCTLICAKPDKKVRIENVAPDEFIIERRATSIYTAGFLAHRGKRTISDLLECGYDQEMVMSIPRGDDNDYTQERIQRFSDEDQLPYGADDETDPTMRKVWVTEAYIKCDYDGDGIAEWRQVTLAGDSTSAAKILANEECDDHPFADLTPDPEPHKFYGQSIFDKTKDIQEIKTALLRGILDSTYLANAPRLGAVDGQVNMDDLLDARPGGIVRMKRADALVPIPTTLVSAAAMEVVQYIDNVKEKRSGISGAGAGLDPNILNSTATGADILNNNNQQHLELMCRIFAETGVKRLFRIIFKLVCQHQDTAKMVKLRNKWVNVNPRDWKDKMDVTATVGLGMGSKSQQAGVAKMMLEMDQQIIAMQGGIDGPLVKIDNVFAKLKKLVEAVGWKSAAAYYSDPKDYVPPPPKPPTPEQQIHMMEMQATTEKIKAETDSAKATALANIQNKTIDYQMKQVDREIKLIELAALKLTSQNKVAQMADNENTTSPLD